MTIAAQESRTPPERGDNDDVKQTLNRLQALFDASSRRQNESEYFEELETQLRALHAQIRVHHAVGHYCPEAAAQASPELTDEFNRLAEEHPIMLGKLDRIIRAVDSMADRPQEDKDVFFLRGHEVIALVRRHEAEEDRIFFLSVWRETGGES